jgi:Protein of unknown function (DUF3641)
MIFTAKRLSLGVGNDEMMEAVHVGAAMVAGDTLVHSAQMRKIIVLDKRLIVRSNLVVMLEPAYQHYMDVFAANNVELVGSLPDYNADKTDRQRGDGTFELVTKATRALNKKSFGVPGSGLALHLVHNPVGAYLPGPQYALEAEYCRVLRDAHGLQFNTLFCMVNSGAPDHIEKFEYARLAEREIVVRSHCFACTAGAGSSCQGALAP